LESEKETRGGGFGNPQEVGTVRREAHDMLEARCAQLNRTTVFATLGLLVACSTFQLPIEGQRDASYRRHPGGALLAYLGWVQEGDAAKRVCRQGNLYPPRGISKLPLQ
jgi:hypothetical protein